MVVWLHADPWHQKHNRGCLNNEITSLLSLTDLLPVSFLKRTCGEHARVGVSRGETHVLLDASTRAFGHPLDGQVLGLLHYPPPGAALIMNSLHSAVQWRLKGLQLGGGFPQQEARHKLTQHWWTLILLNARGREEMRGKKSAMMLTVRQSPGTASLKPVLEMGRYSLGRSTSSTFDSLVYHDFLLYAGSTFPCPLHIRTSAEWAVVCENPVKQTGCCLDLGVYLCSQRASAWSSQGWVKLTFDV